MLKTVSLSRNANLAVDVRFQGQVPRFQLRALMLSGCDLDNSIITGGPNLLATQRRLEILDLSNNNLSGSIPSWIFTDGSSALAYLNIARNSLAGPLGSMWQHASVLLRVINMSTNCFGGHPPGNISSVFPSLVVLDASHNLISGSIPPSLCDIAGMELVDLSSNKLSGEVPSCLFTKNSERLCRLQHLNIIDLSHNRLQGSLPPCIGDISFGRGPYDAQALFSVYDDVELLGLGLGDIDDPSFMFTTTSQYSIVQSFTFSTKGSVRVYSSGFLDLMFGIDLSANMLSGEIPFRMGNLSSVKSLNPSNNFFTGQIPATFAGMRAIESLDLSHNGLSGQIPCELTKLWSLEVFSVAYNNLSGCVPWSGQFSTFSTDSYVGNVNLHSTCVSDSSPIKEEAAGASYQEEDPVLYTMSVTAFLLAFFATVSIMLFHSFLSFGRGTDPINFFDVISSLQR